MHVGMYDCMRSESESELGNQLSGILRNANKETSIPVCLCMYMGIMSERVNQHHTRHHRSSRVYTCKMQARARVCWYYFTNLSSVSVCLPVHTVTQKHTHKRTSNTAKAGKYVSSNDRKSFICIEGGQTNRTHTITHSRVLTASVACLGKRQAAPTLCPCPKDPVYQRAWGRSLSGRAAHRRSRH
jgi:hypothetical protein